MTNKEAIKRIKEHIAIHKYRESHAIHIVEALEMAISALQAQDVPDANVGKIDKYGYIGIETLLNFCDNSKYHAVAVTPNDFMRMKRVRMPEICEDAVSRKAAVEEIRRYGVGSFDFEDYTPEQAERFVIKLLQKLPSVTPKQKDGKWIKNYLYSGSNMVLSYTCSECGAKIPVKCSRNFCPNCGAKMNGGEQE